MLIDATRALALAQTRRRDEMRCRHAIIDDHFFLIADAHIHKHIYIYISGLYGRIKYIRVNYRDRSIFYICSALSEMFVCGKSCIKSFELFLRDRKMPSSNTYANVSNVYTETNTHTHTLSHSYMSRRYPH